MLELESIHIHSIFELFEMIKDIYHIIQMDLEFNTQHNITM